MKYCVLLFVLMCMAGCNASSTGISAEIAQHFQSSGRTLVNLPEVVTIPWDRVCILGPYSNNDSAKTTLGFDWDAESKTSIQTNEGITVLLFVKDQTIVEFVEHLRINGDFANLSRQCFAREKAMFAHQVNPKKGWPGLFPKE
ncbi:MAG: hypothetical protein ACPGYT_13340 [Nitrospirales bacterium]